MVAVSLKKKPLYAAGVWIYLRTTRAKDAAGRWGFVGLAAMLGVVYLGGLAGPPPPSVPAIYSSALVGGALLVLWAWWVDGHRAHAR